MIVSVLLQAFALSPRTGTADGCPKFRVVRLWSDLLPWGTVTSEHANQVSGLDWKWPSDIGKDINLSVPGCDGFLPFNDHLGFTGFEYSPSNEMTEIKASSKWSYIVESSFNCFPKTQPAECVWVAIEMAVTEPRLIMHVWSLCSSTQDPHS